jgi:hypothetical protein
MIVRFYLLSKVKYFGNVPIQYFACVKANFYWNLNSIILA